MEEKAFEVAMRTHGQALRIQELPDTLSRGLKDQLTVFRFLAPFAYCGFLANSKFNAVAMTREGNEFVGIYYGAEVLIARYAYCLFSDPDMFTSIGNPAAEAAKPKLIEELRRPLGMHSLSPQDIPNDPVRFLAAQHLASCAYLILFMHEVAHLELCHLQLLKDNLGFAEIQEVTAAPLSIEEALLFRTLEWDADNAALMTALKVWRNSFPSKLDFSAIAPLGAAGSWFVAAQLLFWVMDFVQPLERRGLLATHPSPDARFVNAIVHAKKFVPELGDESRVSELSLSFWVAKNGFPSQTLEDARQSKGYSTTVEQLAEVHDNYKKIMEQLACYQNVRLTKRGVVPPTFPIS